MGVQLTLPNCLQPFVMVIWKLTTYRNLLSTNVKNSIGNTVHYNCYKPGNNQEWQFNLLCFQNTCLSTNIENIILQLSFSTFFTLTRRVFRTILIRWLDSQLVFVPFDFMMMGHNVWVQRHVWYFQSANYWFLRFLGSMTLRSCPKSRTGTVDDLDSCAHILLE